MPPPSNTACARLRLGAGTAFGGTPGVPKTLLTDTHLSPLSKGGYTVQATVSKPVSESLFHYWSVSLSFRTVVSMEGGSYDFRVVLTCCYPLEAHFSRIAGEKGMEPQFGRFSISESVRRRRVQTKRTTSRSGVECRENTLSQRLAWR